MSRRPDRYVLVRVLRDGTPAAVRPASSLHTALEELEDLVAESGERWQVFDLHANKPIEPLPELSQRPKRAKQNSVTRGTLQSWIDKLTER